MSDERPTAFVIMPFGSEFDPVYNHFLAPALDEAGYEPVRADDIRSQRNILQDIVEAIIEAKLIVADLTTANPNVFYELGLAHALQKPVVLLTQELDDVPFDLQSYRLLPYSTHFQKIGKARISLKEYASGNLNGTIRFSSPVSDFTPSPVPAPSSSPRGKRVDDATTGAPRTQPQRQEDQRGFIDHAEALDRGYARLLEILEETSELNKSMSTSVENTTETLNSISKQRHGQPLPYAKLRGASFELTKELETYTEAMQPLNEEYAEIAKEVDNSLEFLVTFQNLEGDEDLEALCELAGTLRQTVTQGEGGIEAFRDLADTMEGTPPLEKNLNRSIRNAAGEVRRMADNIEISVAAIYRGLERAEDLIGDRECPGQVAKNVDA